IHRGYYAQIYIARKRKLCAYVHTACGSMLSAERLSAAAIGAAQSSVLRDECINAGDAGP
ncbi:hypothetical protein, partial [Escherichia coli]|uniref:hypothetical protein n=1 Tax=Escherichia coli TaxID=562 RepID=UPI001954A5DC